MARKRAHECCCCTFSGTPDDSRGCGLLCLTFLAVAPRRACAHSNIEVHSRVLYTETPSLTEWCASCLTLCLFHLLLLCETEST